MPRVQAMYFDWDSYRWKVVLTDGYHTYHGASLWLSIAYMMALARFTFDGM